jgi:hypothetical protein
MQGWIFKRLETKCVVFCLVVVAKNRLLNKCWVLGFSGRRSLVNGYGEAAFVKRIVGFIGGCFWAHWVLGVWGSVALPTYTPPL